jgi:hypothetical protein
MAMSKPTERATRSLVISLVALLVDGSVATAQIQPPPPLIHYGPPRHTALSHTATCAGRTLSFAIQADHGAHIKPTFLQSAGAAMTAADLARWTQGFDGLKAIRGVEVLCGENEDLIVVEGYLAKPTGDASTTVVTVRVRGADLDEVFVTSPDRRPR